MDLQAAHKGASPHPGDKRKRPNDTRRPSIYGVPEPPNTEDAPPPSKRRLRSAKSPPVPPKRTRAHPISEFTVEIPAPPSKTSAKPPPGRGRGRLKKDQHLQATVEFEAEHTPPNRSGRPSQAEAEEEASSLFVASPRRESRHDSPAGQTTQSQTRQSAGLQKNGTISNHRAMPAGDTSGISDILANPSPVKPVEAIWRQPAPVPRKERSRSARGSTEQEEDDISEDDDEEGTEHDSDVNGQEKEILYLNIEDLRNMVDRSEQVGSSLNISQNSWSVVKPRGNPMTVPGKRLDRRLNRLVIIYKHLERGRPLQECSGTPKAEVTTSLETEITQVMENRLQPINPSSQEPDDNVHTMLLDLYFRTFPLFFEVIYLCSKAHLSNNSSDRPDLNELLRLINLLLDLASTAIAQSRDNQPRPLNKNLTYQIMQPTRELVPRLRSLSRKLTNELGQRQRIQKELEFERSRPERERLRKEREERQNAEKKRQRNARRRLQQEALAAQLGRPFWDGFRPATIRSQASQEPSVSSTQNNARRPQTDSDHESDDDIIDYDIDNPNVERVQMIPRNNTNGTGGARPFTPEERDYFIVFMQKNNAKVKDRYQRLASKLGRTMDEVFAYAKEVQEAMDAQHEKLLFCEECDEWTYDIWVQSEKE